jgi:hypothetical protein
MINNPSEIPSNQPKPRLWLRRSERSYPNSEIPPGKRGRSDEGTFPSPVKRCQLNRSMRHPISNCYCNASRRESICTAALNQNLDGAFDSFELRPADEISIAGTYKRD